MNPITKSFIVVSAILFLSAFMPVPQLQAAIFDGTTINGQEAGYCLDNPDDPDCLDLCDSPAGQNDPRCMSEAQAGTGLAKDSLEGTGITHTDNFGDFIKKLVNFSLPYLVLAAFLGYVVAGFMYVTAFGNDEQMQKAKKIIVWVSVGLILVILSYAITNLLTGELVHGLQGQPASSPANVPQPSNPNL